MSEMISYNNMAGTPELGVQTALFIGLIVGFPTALVAFRKGYLSAGLLTLFAVFNTISIYARMQAGDPQFSLMSIIVSLTFVALFGRAAWTFWKMRKQRF